MLHRLAATLSAMSLLSFFGCSPRSTEMPASLAELRVEVAVEQSSERGDDTPEYDRTAITAVLYHARGGAIERRDVQVEVNGVPLEFRVGTGNYYDRHPYYRLPEGSPVHVLAATDYRFVLVLPDGARHEIGTVRTAAALTTAQIDFPRRRPAGAAVVVGWRDLPEAAELAIFRSDGWRQPDGTQVLEAGSSNDPAALRRTIGPGWFRARSDRFTVPEEFLATRDGHELRTLGVEFVVARTGRVAKTFAKTSTMRAVRRLELRMACGAAD